MLETISFPPLQNWLNYLEIMKKLQFAKIECQCGYTNPIPIIEVFHVYENIKCEKCGKVIAKPE